MKIHTNSRFIRIMTSLSVLCAFMMFANPLQASTLSNAQYMRPIDITNSGAASTNNAVLFDPDTLGMLNSGFINSSLTGSAITDLSNRDLIYMPKEPLRYKLVKYLESDGNQFVDTGYVPNLNTKWVANFSYTTTPGATSQFGLYENSTESGGQVRCVFSVSTSLSIAAVWGTGQITGTLYSGAVDQIITGIIDLKNSFSSIQGNVNTAFTTSAGTPTESLYLFVRHNPNATGGVDANSVGVRIYSSQIYENGVLVRDFVPVQRTTDDVLGMLDRVNNVFYPNIGTGTFSTEQYTNSYYVASYLESSGSQYIITATAPSSNTDVIVTGQFLEQESSDQTLFGVYDNISGSATRYYVGSYNNSQLVLTNNYVGTTRLPNTYGVDFLKHTYSLLPTLGYASVDEKSTTFTNSAIDIRQTFAIMGRNNYNNGVTAVNALTTGRFNSATVFNSQVLNNNYIPCYNSVSQQAGVLDIVSNTFFTNNGSGTINYKLSGTSGDWIIYLPTVAANTTLQERLYISTENLDSKIAYFPGETGMTVNRNSSNTISGSDDWKFSVKGHSISGDGSYLFKYGDNLYATMSGNTITFAYGTITVPTGTYTHNTNWLYYWGDADTTFTGDTTISYGTTFMQNQRPIDGAYNYTYITPSANVSGYNTLIVRAYDNTTNANTKQYVGTGTGALPTTAQTITDNALTRISISTGSVRPNVTVRSSLTSGDVYNRIYLMAVAKADNPTNYSTLTKYGSSASAMISNSTNMLNDLAACMTLATKCTGDFMWQCVANSTFTTALNSSPYKSIITSSVDWAKALAWNTGSYSTTTPSAATVSLTATQQVPVGYHTYDFRKEGNTISLYVDNNLVRGGIFNETSYYTAITSLGYTYSQLVNYTTSPQITFAESGVILYADEIMQTKNSTSVGQWKWTHTDTFTFPDQSGNGNTGNPSFRTEPYGSVNNGQNLSVNLGAYSPANTSQYIPPGGTTDSDFDGLIPNNQQPDQNVDIENIKNIPFAEVFEDILAAGGIPSQLFWLPLIMTLAIAAMMVTYNFTRDALIACIAGDVVIGLGIALSVLYTVPLVIGIITTIVLLVKRKTISL